MARCTKEWRVLLNHEKSCGRVTNLVLRMDNESARGVAQRAGLLIEGFPQPFQCQDAQCVLGYSHKPLWTLLRGKSCNATKSLKARFSHK